MQQINNKIHFDSLKIDTFLLTVSGIEVKKITIGTNKFYLNEMMYYQSTVNNLCNVGGLTSDLGTWVDYSSVEVVIIKADFNWPRK